MEISDWEKEIERKERREDEIKLETERLERLLEMPFIKRMQEPEFKEELKVLEIHQREAFDKFIKKKFPDKLKEIDDLFAEFMTELLHGKVKNMKEFMGLK